MCSCLLFGLIVHSVYGFAFGENVAEENPNDSTHGYAHTDITQGIGYGHYLHPFYYRGPSKKFYDCALGDEWQPQERHKVTKTSPIKKYNTSERSLEGSERRAKLRPEEREHRRMARRGDRGPGTDDQLRKEHAKLLSDINSMSAGSNFLKYFREESGDHGRRGFSSGKRFSFPSGDSHAAAYEVHEESVDPDPGFLNTVPHHMQSMRPFVKAVYKAAPRRPPYNSLAAEVNDQMKYFRPQQAPPVSWPRPPSPLTAKRLPPPRYEPHPVTFKWAKKPPPKSSLLERILKYFPKLLLK